MSLICASFDKLAARVWTDLRDSHHSGLLYGEESITDHLLLTLTRMHSSEVYVKQFTHHEEGYVTGADWEWWLGGTHGWFRMRIQAKKLRLSTQTYPELLRHHPRGATRQINRLIRDAKATNAFPAYCFYNYLPNPPDQPSECGRVLLPKQWGCSVSDAFAIRKMLWAHKTSVTDLIPIILPWSCLVCCPREKSLARRAMGVSRILREHAGDLLGEGSFPDVVEQLPAYARRIMDERRTGEDFQEPAWTGVPPRIRGIAVLEQRG